MSHDDFNFEPIRGLPEKLPEGEYILWQGAPKPAALAREALGLRWVAGYFALLTIWRIGASSADFTLTGTLAFELIGDTKLSYLMTWPHVKPWTLSRTQPALRCIPDAQKVASLFAEAAETRIAEPQIMRMEGGGVDAVAAE